MRRFFRWVFGTDDTTRQLAELQTATARVLAAFETFEQRHKDAMTLAEIANHQRAAIMTMKQASDIANTTREPQRINLADGSIVTVNPGVIIGHRPESIN